jgi:hypothetical protein
VEDLAILVEEGMVDLVIVEDVLEFLVFGELGGEVVDPIIIGDGCDGDTVERACYNNYNYILEQKKRLKNAREVVI